MKTHQIIVVLATYFSLTPALEARQRVQPIDGNYKSPESASSHDRMMVLFTVKPASADADLRALNQIDTILSKIRHVRSLMSASVNIDLITRTLNAINALHALALHSGGLESTVIVAIGTDQEYALSNDPEVRALRIWLARKECPESIWNQAIDITTRYNKKLISVSTLTEELTNLYTSLLN